MSIVMVKYFHNQYIVKQQMMSRDYEHFSIH